MDLFQLETFVAVAEERSFSRAAARLHRTQPAVSQAIAKLEGELGEILFERSSRDGTLTDAGSMLREYALKLLNLRTEATGALAELRELHKGKLQIAANEYTCLYLLPLLNEFRLQHPRIKVAVQRSLASRIPDEVLMHSVEIGVLSFRPDDTQIKSTVVYRDELMARRQSQASPRQGAGRSNPAARHPELCRPQHRLPAAAEGDPDLSQVQDFAADGRRAAVD